MRRWFFALTLVLPLVFAAAALAVPPTNEVTTVVNAVTVDEDICADFGFDVTFVENGTFKTRTFYDREGNEVKTILSNFDVRFTSTATANGKTLSTNYPLVFITAMVRTSGLDFATPTTFPGRGCPRCWASHPRRSWQRRVRGRPARPSQRVGRRVLRLLRAVRPRVGRRRGSPPRRSPETKASLSSPSAPGR